MAFLSRNDSGFGEFHVFHPIDKGGSADGFFSTNRIDKCFFHPPTDRFFLRDGDRLHAVFGTLTAKQFPSFDFENAFTPIKGRRVIHPAIHGGHLEVGLRAAFHIGDDIEMVRDSD